MSGYQDFGSIFNVPVFNPGTQVEQPQYNAPECKTLMDFLVFYESANMPADTVDVLIKLRNIEGIETDWINVINLPGTTGLINETMFGRNVGYDFKLKIVNNSPNIINNFKMSLQAKSM